MIEWIRYYWLPVLLWVGGIGVVVGLMVLAAMAGDTFRTSCEAQGGKVLSKTKTDTGFDSTGKPVFITSTTRLCVVDGDVVGIG